MAVAKLIPLIDVECDDNYNRPTVRVYPDKPLVLGRNKVSMIELAYISREHLKIEWKDDSVLLATPLTEKHFIQINDKLVKGPTEIKNDEILSLCNDQVSYQVRYVSLATKSSELSADAKRKFTDHVTCPVCMELLVDTTVLVPCGHRFCKKCCPRDECATCRSTIQSIVADKLYDSFISDLVDEQCLDTDDSESYKQRIGKTVSEQILRFSSNDSLLMILPIVQDGI